MACPTWVRKSPCQAGNWQVRFPACSCRVSRIQACTSSRPSTSWMVASDHACHFPGILRYPGRRQPSGVCPIFAKEEMDHG